MSRWINLLLKLIRQYQAAQRERDPLAGKTKPRDSRATHRIEHGVRVEYSPDLDGAADPGEVVWAWVPYREDESKGKDRPVVVIGRTLGGDGGMLAGVPLTSKNKGRDDHVAVGTGAWDPKRRDSWAKVDRLVEIDPDDVRREGAILAKNRFDDVVDGLSRHHELSRS